MGMPRIRLGIVVIGASVSAVKRVIKAPMKLVTLFPRAIVHSIARFDR
jgi:hypothetical protein